MATGREDDDWSTNGLIRRDFRQDRGNPEVPRHRKKSRGKGKEKPREGCPENDNNSHVYVWVKYVTQISNGRSYFHYQKECVGCRKRTKVGSWAFKPNEVYAVYTRPYWEWSY